MVRKFTRHENAPPKYQGLAYRVKAEHINELQIALEQDDARLDQKADVSQINTLVAGAIADDDTPALAAAAAVSTEISNRDLIEFPDIHTTPTMLISPGQSRTRSGSVTPPVGSGVTLGTGKYGDAWELSGVGWIINTMSAGGEWKTAIVRGYIDMSVPGTSFMQILNTHPFSDSKRIIINLGLHRVIAKTTTSDNIVDTPAVTGHFTVAMRIEDGVLKSNIIDNDGNHVANETVLDGPLAPGDTSNIRFGWGDGAPRNIESAVLYDHALSDSEIERVMSMPEVWTWDNLSPSIYAAKDQAVPVGGTKGQILTVSESGNDWVDPFFGGRPAEKVIATTGAGEPWAITNGSPTVDFSDGTEGIFGTSHISLDLGSSTGLLGVGRALDGPVDLENNLLRVYVKIDGSASLQRILAYGSSDKPSGFTNWSQAKLTRDTYNGERIADGRWQALNFDFANVSDSSGTPDLRSIRSIRLVFTKDGSAPTIARIGGVSLVPRNSPVFPNGVVSITFDDNWISEYTLALPAMARRGFRGTLYTIAEAVENASPESMNMDQLKRMRHLHGWEVASHATTFATHNPGFTELSDVELHSEFEAMKEWIQTNGLGHGNDFAWPLGKFSDESILVARDHLRSARSIYGGGVQAVGALDGEDALKMYGYSMDNVADLTPFQNHVDKAFDSGSWLILYGHKLDTTHGPLTMSMPEFDVLLDYIASKGIPVLPAGEVLDKMGVSRD